MAKLLEHVDRTIRARDLLPDGSVAVVGVSGGLDSTVLLHVLHQLSAAHRWTLVVAHFNHGLRGPEADADEQFVGAMSKELGLRFLSEKRPVAEFAKAHGLSLEMGGRRLRHEFLARAAALAGTVRIALAHHADDQVETFFLRLFRGGSPGSLSGMLWCGPSAVSMNLMLIRPFLDISKAELHEFAREHSIAYREDSSNRACDAQRNRVRNTLLPLLEREFQPSIRKVVLRMAELLQTEGELLDDMACEWLERGGPPFAKLRLALQRRVLVPQLIQLGIQPSFDLVEKLRLQPKNPMSVGSRQWVERDTRGRVVLRRRVKEPFSTDQGRTVELVQQGASDSFAGLSFRWIVVPAEYEMPRTTGMPQECFDADCVGDIVVLRHWKPGDRFQPIGMREAVKLQDLFVNAKVSREERHTRVIAATASGTIWWVEGLRIGEAFKLTPGTHRKLVWAWKRVETKQ